MDAQRKLKARRSTFFAPPVCGSLPSVAVVLEVRASPIAPRRGGSEFRLEGTGSMVEYHWLDSQPLSVLRFGMCLGAIRTGGVLVMLYL